MFYTADFIHALLTNWMHCFTGIISPLSIGSLICSIKKWVLIKRLPNFLFIQNERVDQLIQNLSLFYALLHYKITVKFFWIVYADMIFVHILLSELKCKKCIIIYGKSLDYDYIYSGLGPNSGLKKSVLQCIFF